MRKVLFLIVYTTFLLVSCQPSILSMNEIDSAPSDIQNKINPNYTLQLIYDGENIAYLVYHSKGKVTTDLETLGSTLKVKLDVTDNQDGVIEQRVYKLTFDDKNEVIEVLINGKPTPFDSITNV